MVSNVTLLHIHQRLQEIFGTSGSLLFGGKSIIAVGDFPYERRNAAAALQQFTFMVAQRLSVCKAVLVSR